MLNKVHNILTHGNHKSNVSFHQTYSRWQNKSDGTFHHPYADTNHYHYQCVLNSVDAETRALITDPADSTAIKTHYPYYSGLEGLLNY